MDPRKRWICSSFTQPYCPLWLRNGGRTSNALLAAMLQMEENRPWSIKMKLDVSTALKSQGGGKKSFLLGHFVVVNWPEQLAIMQVMEPLFSFHLGGLCACQSKGRANELQLEVEIDSGDTGSPEQTGRTDGPSGPRPTDQSWILCQL